MVLLVGGASFLGLQSYGQGFTKVTTGPLVTTNGDSRSVNWIDVNNDGFIDCMITNGPNGGQNNMLYINNGSGGFTAVSGDPIVMDGKPSDGATWADTDNDGDLDCFVANWYGNDNLFYLNNGSGVFVTNFGGGVILSGGFSETASWGDYDSDGKVDLFVTRSAGGNENMMFHNDGNNVFTEITTVDMATDLDESRCVNWTDVDDDGDLDLFITNEGGANEYLYKNNGGGAFVKSVIPPLVTAGGNTMSSSWADIDNDGDLDVFVANDQSENILYRNDGNFSFVKLASDTVSTTMGSSFSSAFSDIDNDGDLDLYVTNSFGGGLHNNFLYLNDGHGSFTRDDTSSTVQELEWSYGCAFGDYDNDGFEDLAVATVRYAGNDRPDLLFHNNGNNNNWITIKLTGTITNKAAIGTKVRIKATINGVPVWQMREVSAQSGYCSQNDLRVHFGLGNATSIDSIKLEWLSGTKETYVNVNANQFKGYVEGQSVGVKGMDGRKDISVSPNPTQGAFVISAEGWQFAKGDKIIVTSINGVIVYEYTMKGEEKAHNVGKHLAPGQYFISVKTKTGLRMEKVTKL
jgi:hypothetical protein